MATTHFEATSARKAFPCFDEPRFRATFAISVARLPSQTALSNMPLIRTSKDPEYVSSHEKARKGLCTLAEHSRQLVVVCLRRSIVIGGRIWDDFDTTPSMPTYLVAFIVHELEKVKTAKKNVNVWVRPNAVSDAAIAALVAPQVIDAMEAFTGFALPIPKVDLIAIPTFPIGAMENWGLVTFR